MTIVPLGLNRSSIALQSHRATSTLGANAAALARLEQQVYTQRQFQHGSDSPFNATATLAVQSQVTRKEQNVANLNATQTFLTATSSTLARFNPLTSDARGMALDALNTATSPAQRNALAQTVNQTLQGILNFSNHSFGGRYLFAGAATGNIPFLWGLDSSFTVKYTGSVNDVWSWSDTDLLSWSNVNGVTAFGAISDPMQGKDLDPALTGKTLLRDLNGGRGVDKGVIRFTYVVDGRVHTHDVDLSRCVTIEDVQRTIENSRNPHFSVNVDITANGLVLSVPDNLVGSVSVSEVGRGTTARQLGIATGVDFNRNQPLVGRDLNPALTNTTRLTDLLGTKSSLELRFAGANNNIIIQANHNGSQYDGLSMSLQADVTITPGQEIVEYDAATNTMLIRIHPDNTSANDIIRAINEASAAGTIPPYTASLSGRDQQRSELAGTGIVPLLPGMPVTFGSTSGGNGTDFDLSGIELVNDNAVWSICFAQC